MTVEEAFAEFKELIEYGYGKVPVTMLVLSKGQNHWYTNLDKVELLERPGVSDVVQLT